MMLDVLLQFILELTRALLIEELSSHVRIRLQELVGRRPSRPDALRVRLHRLHRDRLLHRLLTDLENHP